MCRYTALCSADIGWRKDGIVLIFSVRRICGVWSLLGVDQKKLKFFAAYRCRLEFTGLKGKGK